MLKSKELGVLESFGTFDKWSILVLSGNVDRESIVGAEASRTVDHSVPSESQQPLNANVSEPQESQVTSAAIPPDELYSFVFASVEEEMIADASYLFAIIVEFIRR